MKRSGYNPGYRRCSRILTTLSAASITAVAFGQAAVNPATEPFMTLAPYVLQSSNLEPRVGNETGGTRAYRPWFESGSWTGDLIEYEITSDGLRLVRGDIGQYPRDGENWRGDQTLWSARYSFPDYQAYDLSLETADGWQCTEEEPLYWQTRNIFTMSDGQQVPFRWDELTEAQRQTVDAATPGADDDDPGAWDSPILNFIRGDRSNERCKDGGIYRWRFSLLGAIVNSTPVYAPAGSDGVVVVGANDGMLHGFSAADGTELFGYVPSMLMSRLGLLRISPYQPTHFVDGELRHRDIGTPATPQHIVAGGLGAGGKGLFVLDVTTPGNPAVLRELAGSDSDYVGGSYDPRIGHIRGRPTIARIADGANNYRWTVVAGNGYDSNNGTAHLVLIPLDGSAPQFIATDGTPDNGLSAPSLVDVTGNGIVDFAYAGDLHGNLWRFNLNDNSVTRMFSAGTNRPITVEPDIAQHPDTQQGYMVYFGTGSLLSGTDIQNTQPQTIYGLWDRGDGATITNDRLLTQTLVSATVSWPVPPEAVNYCADVESETSENTVRFITGQATPNWSGSTPHLGWRVDLPRSGERLIGHPQIRAGRVQFVTTNPYDMADLDRSMETGAGSWILQLDLASGGNARNPVSLFDMNRNCVLDDGDGLPAAITVGGDTIAAGTFPVGVNLGAYHIAQPAFARVRFTQALRSVVDGVYINALQLPLIDPPVEPAHGPLDVMTDSAFGAAHRTPYASPASTPWNEPWKEPFGNRNFPEASGPTKPNLAADGLGHRVDGHSFAYNYHHGVNYVDLFDLEPQRGALRLDVASVYRAGATSYPRLGPEVEWESRQELNRATEVGIDSEQRFVVMVTNADLSRENRIQIGCRTWMVYEYQTMMMQILRQGDPAQVRAALEAEGLIYTLDGSYNPIRPTSGSLVCTESGLTRTIRITPTERIGTLDATVATLPGCVNNTDRYQGSPPNTYQTRKSALGGDPLDLYVTDPHVTRNREGQGYRWRNGALTVQLLAVNSSNNPVFELQPEAQLPRGSGIEGEDPGWGGAYARAFTLLNQPGNNPPRVVPIHAGLVQPPPDADGIPLSGMLYELSMFWHWGDMTRFQQQGGGNPVTSSCYGAANYTGPALSFETDWFTPGAYQQLTSGFTDELQQEYARLLQELRSDNMAIVEAALDALAALFQEHPNIANYHRLRHYVPNSRQLQEHHLIGLDRGGIGGELVDGTPVEVVDIERDLLPSLGPNYQPGRRSWIDLVPQ
jgi:hypothetical protein